MSLIQEKLFKSGQLYRIDEHCSEYDFLVPAFFCETSSFGDMVDFDVSVKYLHIVLPMSQKLKVAQHNKILN